MNKNNSQKKLPDATIKIKLVGDSNVGKTSIIESLIY